MRNRTIGAFENSSPYCEMTLRQGENSTYPKSYVNKVGSVGGQTLYSQLGITVGSSPQPRIRTAKKATANGLYGCLGIDCEPMNISGQIPQSSRAVACISPSAWAPEDSLADSVGLLMEYDQRPNGCCHVLYRPSSGDVSAKRRTLPEEMCKVCTSKPEFVKWCSQFLPAEVAAEGWDSIVQGQTNTVGRSAPPPF